MEHSDKQIPGKAFTVPTTTSSPFIYFLLSPLRKMKANNKNEALKRNVEIVFRKLKLPWTFGNGAKTLLRPYGTRILPEQSFTKFMCFLVYSRRISHRGCKTATCTRCYAATSGQASTQLFWGYATVWNTQRVSRHFGSTNRCLASWTSDLQVKQLKST